VLAQRILPPPGVPVSSVTPESAAPGKTSDTAEPSKDTKPAPKCTDTSPSPKSGPVLLGLEADSSPEPGAIAPIQPVTFHLGAPETDKPDTPDKGRKSGEAEKKAETAPSTPEESSCHPAGKPLTLPDAIALAFHLQPRLRASLESIQQARGREDIAFAAFLPTATAGYVAGGYHIQAGGTGFSIPGAPNSPTFTVLPFLGTIPSGIAGQTGFEVAELKLQWLVCDFGRRLGRYNQAGLAVDIAQLQTERAYQTIANEVAVAYYQVLRARSLRRIATEAVRRAEDDLEVARKQRREGAVVRETVLRAEVALAQAQRAGDVAEEVEAVAVAALNLAIGLNVSEPTCVVETEDRPAFPLCLADCLHTAVGARREFRVARESVQVAQAGSRVARADFAPRIVAEGNALDFQQSSPRGHFDLPFAFIKLEWELFEGGKRVAEVRVADSRIREAMAQAESIADTIAFQVTQAYRQLVAARQGIDRSRPAVEQTRETHRLVLARLREGAAIPAELTEAEAAMTRAQQDYANAGYDYLTALARLEYAMGTTPTDARVGSHR
jgi:outer membrane protein TolC